MSNGHTGGRTLNCRMNSRFSSHRRSDPSPILKSPQFPDFEVPRPDSIVAWDPVQSPTERKTFPHLEKLAAEGNGPRQSLEPEATEGHYYRPLADIGVHGWASLGATGG